MKNKNLIVTFDYHDFDIYEEFLNILNLNENIILKKIIEPNYHMLLHRNNVLE